VREKILVVEDDTAIREALSYNLGREGYEVLTVGDGAEALQVARGAKPNLPDDPPWATPLAWAARRGHGQIVELLKQHGAT